ncbi:expressed protein [Echinococcus multilocularis]|uniref:Secreted protein n=2 Tax=Echinococcus TaxID=6209 RepID=A0A068WVI3_ECHGR|nr:hypothetical protein EgrG_000724400 [Echinococcus granulosus]CDS39700.1 expressed protein [Echinococcus multilocularis]
MVIATVAVRVRTAAERSSPVAVILCTANCNRSRRASVSSASKVDSSA